MNQHGYFFSNYCVGVCIILKKVIQVNERFMLALRGLWWGIGLLFKKSPLMPHVLPIFITHWTIL
jgi:hypothetical protein